MSWSDDLYYTLPNAALHSQDYPVHPIHPCISQHHERDQPGPQSKRRRSLDSPVQRQWRPWYINGIAGGNPQNTLR